MIKIENVETYGWEAAIRGMRNPLNSWEKSDTHYHGESCEQCPHEFTSCNDHHQSGVLCFQLGENDLKLMQTLCHAGSDHRKFMRMLTATMDITAPFYWWKEFDTYKVGTVANSCSTMHKLMDKEFTRDDFSTDKLDYLSLEWLDHLINYFNVVRIEYLRSHDKEEWMQIIQLLPSSYNQKRTVQLNYEVMRNMYHARKNHKLDEWHGLCGAIENLPYAKELICGVERKEKKDD